MLHDEQFTMLRQKINALIDKNNQLRLDVQKLEKQLQAKQQTINEQQQTIERLEMKVSTTDIVQLGNKKEDAVTKKKIDSLIAEIDACIQYLNTSEHE